ncbi:hypothetical protein BXY41_106227 [Lacrimispora xylanisolvens]|uniref:Uncharacterized protein n=1 Tax=Lacrimispora xylanisolvens TaxID=384636 RepID=A0A2S6HSI2_9FIRM|nr:hypothetical protein [Hungatella xylanolytica]PPK80637.1 hypothetical protein BXY41_106227 [Hungatella xylanolytica]
MEKWFSWIIKHLGIVTALLFVIIIGIPIIIHICFKISAPYEFLVADWDSGSVLSYYGSVLGFLGTVILSILALYQNQEIKKEADKRSELLERTIHSPELKLSYLASYGGNYSNMQFELENISNNLADNITVGEFKVFDKSGNIIDKPNQNSLYKSHLSGKEKLTFSFINGKLDESNLKLEFIISCEDKFHNNLHYKATMIIVNPDYCSYTLNFVRI